MIDDKFARRARMTGFTDMQIDRAGSAEFESGDDEKSKKAGKRRKSWHFPEAFLFGRSVKKKV